LPRDSTSDVFSYIIAAADEVAAAAEEQVLDVGSQRVARQRGPDRVNALTRILDHHIARIGYLVAVVAGAAEHGVGARAPGQRVVVRQAEYLVGQYRADQDIVSVRAGDDGEA